MLESWGSTKTPGTSYLVCLKLSLSFLMSDLPLCLDGLGDFCDLSLNSSLSLPQLCPTRTILLLLFLFPLPVQTIFFTPLPGFLQQIFNLLPSLLAPQISPCSIRGILENVILIVWQLILALIPCRF